VTHRPDRGHNDYDGNELKKHPQPHQFLRAVWRTEGPHTALSLTIPSSPILLAIPSQQPGQDTGQSLAIPRRPVAIAVAIFPLTDRRVYLGRRLGRFPPQ
jgi:hypothetical protein